MFSKADLEAMSLKSLYELLAIKKDELMAISRLNCDYEGIQKDVELIQRIIDTKKVQSITE